MMRAVIGSNAWPADIPQLAPLQRPGERLVLWKALELVYRLVLWKALELAWDLVSLCSSQWVSLLSCMVVSLLLFSAPPDSKVVEQMLLQLALWMYADREANLVWAVAVLLAIELLVKRMLLLLLGWLW